MNAVTKQVNTVNQLTSLFPHG